MKSLLKSLFPESPRKYTSLKYVRYALASLVVAIGFSVVASAEEIVSSGAPRTVSVPSSDVAVVIIIGQSNADGSAFFDAVEDARMMEWYESSANPGNMKIWYRSTKVENQAANRLGEAARWVVDGDTVDAEPGWLNLWYRNENTLGRTAMNMIHGYGTYSTGSSTDCARGRRGIEGELGIEFDRQFPGRELYVMKLGVSGSFISSWADSLDNTNWNYFYEKIYTPAMTDLLARGKSPRLAGIWWMQGCADSSRPSSWYESRLRYLIEKCRRETGFENGRFYIGRTLGLGDTSLSCDGSEPQCEGVREAQEAVAASMEGVEIIETRDISRQYESGFGGYLHFDHQGQNQIARRLVGCFAADGPDSWVPFRPSAGSPVLLSIKSGLSF